jgi:hypothetical protein
LDFAVIQPKADNVHCLAEEPSGCFSMRTMNGGPSAISRSFLLPVRRERGGLSVGAASRKGAHQ